ncbi:hypothetical protein CEXT_771401 [Caerostris extrusa]|uniref:Uncharacterized protein n=1 Tax=Caerostris extrusa TaxID=172846 RepID=A0AAV4TLY5_CAEEX|nr:hypothetical protein CEXT_771401 [Caerostris extrusa]
MYNISSLFSSFFYFIIRHLSQPQAVFSSKRSQKQIPNFLARCVRGSTYQTDYVVFPPILGESSYKDELKRILLLQLVYITNGLEFLSLISTVIRCFCKQFSLRQNSCLVRFQYRNVAGIEISERMVKVQRFRS